jgi:hypothetical protein
MPVRIALSVLLAALVLAGAAVADAPPVGPLPPGPTTQIAIARGELFAVALPGQRSGRVWRLKGSIDARIVREVRESDVGSTVVIVFKAVGRGTTKLTYGATRGETAKAFAGKRFTIRVS